MQYIKYDDLVEGQIYEVFKPNSKETNFIVMWNKKVGSFNKKYICLRPGGREPTEYNKMFYSTTGGFRKANNNRYVEASSMNKKWLEQCIDQGSLVGFENTLLYDIY